MRMGAGGVLKEIPTRPQPRAGADAAVSVTPPRAPKIAAVVLAAGRSSRMGPANKLLADVDGIPMVRRDVEAAVGSQARPVNVGAGNGKGKIQGVVHC